MHPCHNGESSNLPIGTRIEFHRRRHGLSRRALANLIGRSEEWLRLIETGQLQLDSVRVVTRLAYVLRIDDLRELIDWPTSPIPSTRTPGADARNFIRAILTSPVPQGKPRRWCAPKTDELHAMMDRCIDLWQHSPSRYSALMISLPEALATSLQAFLATMDAEHGFITARVHQLASNYLNRAGLPWLACVAGDRATRIGDHLRQPALSAAGAWHVGHALLLLGLPHQALDHVTVALEQLGRAKSIGPEREVLRGALRLTQARASAAAGDLRTATQLMAQANAPTAPSPDQSAFGITFGTSRLRLAQLELALETGDFTEVTRLATQLETPDDSPVADRAAYHLQVAYAFACRNDDIAAAFSLTKAASLSVEELHYNPYGRNTLKQLIRHDNRLVNDDIIRLIQKLSTVET